MTEPTPGPYEVNEPQPPHLATRAAVNRLAQMLTSGAISPGDASALRRLSQHDVASPAFWRVVTVVLEPRGVFIPVEAERRWAVILAALAELDGQHVPRVHFGTALAAADVTEMRVLRLLRAHDDALFDVVRHIAHQLCSKAEYFDLAELADLVLSDGTAGEETVRRRIARDFYTSLQKKEAAQ